MSQAQDFLRSLVSLHQDTEECFGVAEYQQLLATRVRHSLKLENESSSEKERFSESDVDRICRDFKLTDITESDLDKERPYGDPLLQQIFRPMIIEASKYAKQFGITDEELGEIGTLPIGTPNAMAIAVPNSSEFVVVFQRGLPLFLNRMSKIALEADFNIRPESYREMRLDEDGWQDRYRSEIRDSLKRYEIPLNHLLSLMFFTIIANDPSLAPPHSVPFSVSLTRTILLYHMEMFVIGHELAHIGKGHLSSDKRKVVYDFNGRLHEALSTESAQEIEADIFGWTISDASALREPDGENKLFEEFYYYGVAAPGFFLSCVLCLERFTKLIHKDWCPCDTHPPTELRKSLRHYFLLDVGNRAGYVTAEKLDIVLDEMFLIGAEQFEILCADYI